MEQARLNFDYIDSSMDREAVEKYVTDYLSAKGFLSVPGTQYVVLPGFCDVHVHFREPGFSYKETVRTGSMAAAHGGYTAVCAMPNLKPVPDSRENLEKELEIIRRDAVIDVLPYGAITKGEEGQELADMDAMAKDICAFSDDGHGVQKDGMMREGMLRAKSLGKLIAAHCEDNTLLFGGYIHDGDYAKEHGHRGICSASEYLQIERDLQLVKETGCGYHVCHVSTKESVALLRRAKAEGLNVSCETGPHYLILTDRDLQEEGRFKMNPPLREEEDRQALLDGVMDGTIDAIATDHAPHTAEEKSRGLEKSPFGITGIETAFPLMYTEFVRTGYMTMEKLLELICYRPRERFGIAANGFTVFEVAKPYKINPNEFLSMGKSTPFAGKEVYGTCVLTVSNGKNAYEAKAVEP